MSYINSFKLAFLLVIFFIVQQECHADWQYTKWGMTADEIVAASNGTARTIHGSEKKGKSGETFDTIAIATFSTGPFEFDVQFRTLKGKTVLDTVRLKLNNYVDYSRLRDTLIAKYGSGEVTEDKSENIDTITSKWIVENDTITLIYFDVKMINSISV